MREVNGVTAKALEESLREAVLEWHKTGELNKALYDCADEFDPLDSAVKMDRTQLCYDFDEKLWVLSRAASDFPLGFLCGASVTSADFESLIGVLKGGFHLNEGDLDEIDLGDLIEHFFRLKKSALCQLIGMYPDRALDWVFGGRAHDFVEEVLDCMEQMSD